MTRSDFFFCPPLEPPEFPRRGLYARVTRVDALGEGPLRAQSFEFDTIDADITDAAGPQVRDLFQEGEKKPLALLRIVTTVTRFLVFAGDVPTPGDWFFLKSSPGVYPWSHDMARPAGRGATRAILAG